MEQAMTNPLPTPEEHLNDSFKSNEEPSNKNADHFDKYNEWLGSGNGKSRITPPPLIRVSSAKDEHTTEAVIGRKRSHEESEDQSEVQYTPKASAPAFGYDFSLVDTEPSQTSTTPLFTPALPARPRTGLVEAACKKNPAKYFQDRLAELDLMREWKKLALHDAHKKAVAKEQKPKRQRGRRRVQIPDDTYEVDQSPPEEYVHEFSTPVRPSRSTRRMTPHPRVTPVQAISVLSTPPPTTPSHRPAPSARRDSAIEQEFVTFKKDVAAKKAIAKDPISKKKNVTKKNTPKKANKVVKNAKGGKPAAKPGSTQHTGELLKAVLNSRYINAGYTGEKRKNCYWLYDDAFVPQIDFDEVGETPFSDRGVLPKEFPKDIKDRDPLYTWLHPKEIQLAERARASPSEYITQKRRYFLGLCEWYRLGFPECKRAHTQPWCNQDGNSTSLMWRAYDSWGLNDRSIWTDDLIKSRLSILPGVSAIEIAHEDMKAPRLTESPATTIQTEFEEEEQEEEKESGTAVTPAEA